jgi:hypothetical protein
MLVKMVMEVDEYGEFIMKSYTKEYTGTVTMKNESVICFELKGTDKNDPDLYALVHAIIPNNANFSTYGTFIWSELSKSVQLGGKCFIEKTNHLGKPEVFSRISRNAELYQLWRTLEPLDMDSSKLTVERK